MKTITVKGVGKASVKPDTVVLSLSLETKDSDYETAMREAADRIKQLNKRFESIGFEMDAVKTTDFNVRTEYENKKNRNGDYYRVFEGFAVNHRLKVTFDFDTEVLSGALGVVATSVTDPELSIKFTVKDPSAVNEALLKSAAENARQKAEILCAASKVALGELVNIDYNWGELNVYSRTDFDIGMDCMAKCAAEPFGIDIQPDDIDLSDSVTFMWEIV